MEDLLPILFFVIYIVYNFFIKKKDNDASAPKKGRAKDQSQKPVKDPFQDILKEVFGHKEEEEKKEIVMAPQPVPEFKSEKTVQFERKKPRSKYKSLSERVEESKRKAGIPTSRESHRIKPAKPSMITHMPMKISHSRRKLRPFKFNAVDAFIYKTILERKYE